MHRDTLTRIFRKLPQIETPRLLLRKVTLDDAEAFFSFFSDRDTTKYLTELPHASINETKRKLSAMIENYSRGRQFNWAVEEKESREVVGSCSYQYINTHNYYAEAGYVISSKKRGQGYATEVLLALCRFAFEDLDCHRVQITYFPENVTSAHIGEKCGFTREGVRRKCVFRDGEFYDSGCSSILRSEFEERYGLTVQDKPLYGAFAKNKRTYTEEQFQIKQ